MDDFNSDRSRFTHREPWISPLAGAPAGGEMPARWVLYRQPASSPVLERADVLVGTFSSCREAMDARDADVVTQLGVFGGFHCEVAHLIVAHTAAQGASYYPMFASVGGGRILIGEDLQAGLLDTARWLSSQRQD